MARRLEVGDVVLLYGQTGTIEKVFKSESGDIAYRIGFAGIQGAVFESPIFEDAKIISRKDRLTDAIAIEETMRDPRKIYLNELRELFGVLHSAIENNDENTLKISDTLKRKFDKTPVNNPIT